MDIKLSNWKRCFCWRIYDQVVEDALKSEDSGEEYRCCCAGMGTCHCRNCGF